MRAAYHDIMTRMTGLDGVFTFNFVNILIHPHTHTHINPPLGGSMRVA